MFQSKRFVSHLPFLFFILLLACQPSPPKDKSSTLVFTGKEILEKSRHALKQVTSTSYHFEFAYPNAPIGWAKGSGKTKRVKEVADSKINIKEKVQFQEGADTLNFHYVTNGEMAWLVDFQAQTVETGRNDKGARAIALLSTYGYLPEYLEKVPYWKELTRANRIELTGNRIIGESTMFYSGSALE